MTERKKLFSGIQPTGELHFGNLVGALDNWVTMQKEYEAYYCVVDLHAMTVPYDSAELARTRLNTAKLVISAGVDPVRSLFYFQSQVPQHAELTWILGTIAGIGQLERMTQYKEKADRAGQNLGLLSYPVLMAADILIHRVNAVPVGDDQTQHLELTRDLVLKFNSRHGEIFPLPDRVTPKLGARVMSLQNPQAKMSKSDPDPDSRVNLLDEPDVIRKKFKGSVTDSERTVRYDWDEKPGVSNLLELLAFSTGRSLPELEQEYAEAGYGRLKEAVAEAVVERLTPIRTKFKAMDDDDVSRMMQKGALDARARAEGTMVTVRRAVGLAG